MYTDGFVQDSSISIANALETLQSCTKQLLYIAMGCLLWVIVQNWLCYNGTTLYKPFFFLLTTSLDEFITESTVAYFTKEVNLNLAKLTLKFNDSLGKLKLVFLNKVGHRSENYVQ